MRIPSIKSLLPLTAGDKEKAKLVRFALEADQFDVIDSGKFPVTAAWLKQCYHAPGEWHFRMECADEALGMYGTESIEGKGGRRLEYCNVGDPYATTLCFEFRKGMFGGDYLHRVFVGNWGDWVERWGRKEE